MINNNKQQQQPKKKKKKKLQLHCKCRRFLREPFHIASYKLRYTFHSAELARERHREKKKNKII